MAWKQDLAKLKQQLPPEPTPAPPKPPPRPSPLPGGPPRLDDEDAVFLSAMGLKPARAPRPALPEAQDSKTQGAPPPQPPPETFEAALKDLKGLKPLAQALPGLAPSTAVPPPPPPALPTPPEAPPLPVAEAPALEALPEPAPPVPQAPIRFQLAAGMAIEVDGSLDLRGHTLLDATERLKDRLGDGLFLGWRSLQVILGTDPLLHEGLLVLLSSGDLPMVSRYAQAPIPMGGAQAWLLYLTPPSPQPPPGA